MHMYLSQCSFQLKDVVFVFQSMLSFLNEACGISVGARFLSMPYSAFVSAEICCLTFGLPSFCLRFSATVISEQDLSCLPIIHSGCCAILGVYIVVQ